MKTSLKLSTLLAITLTMTACGKKESATAVAAPAAAVTQPAANLAEPVVTDTATNSNTGLERYNSKADLTQAIRDGKFAAARNNVEFKYSYGTSYAQSTFFGLIDYNKYSSSTGSDIRTRKFNGTENLYMDRFGTVTTRVSDEVIKDNLIKLVETSSEVGYVGYSNIIFVKSGDASTLYYFDMSKTLIENPIMEQKKHSDKTTFYVEIGSYYSQSSSSSYGGQLLN